MSALHVNFNIQSIVHASRVFTDTIVASVRSGASHLQSFLTQSSEHRQATYEEAYLAESVDRYDLEYRMRELDRANHQPFWLTGIGR